MMFVLIFVVGHGFYSGDTIHMQSFSSKERCEIAGKTAADLMTDKASARGYYKCVEQ